MRSDNFRGKYTKSGFIGRLLLNHFFNCVKELIQYCNPQINRVLEVGVGEGFSTERIKTTLAHHVNFEASEFHTNLVKIAAGRNPQVKVQQESVYELNREDDSFDLVICLEVLEHLDNPSLALRELSRVSRSYVIISVPREPIWRILNLMRGKYISNFGNTPGHIQHWSARKIRSFVSPWFNMVAIRTPLPWTLLLLKPLKCQV
ncbi:MAG: hypothetical protein BMS9Abin33_0428 [Gammaproteobacteria bacterium]|nr:MAG: hypothetical protein BMS9Abin33_0428 [Gammaproteobacteria bacterium]